MPPKKSLTKTPGRKSEPKASGRKSSSKTSGENSLSTASGGESSSNSDNLASEKTDWEAVRIVSYVTFDHAYQEYIDNSDMQYRDLYLTLGDDKPKEYDKYYYLIKWKNWREKGTSCTWECETNCLSISYLNAYKKFNGLPKERIRITEEPCSSAPDEVIPEENETGEASDSDSQAYNFYPEDESDNAEFGIVRCSDIKNREKIKDKEEVAIYIMTNKKKKFVLIERNMEDVLKFHNPNNKASYFEFWQQKVQLNDRSYLSSVIQHPNSVKMVDYYFKRESSKTAPVYCYIYEYFKDDLEKKINEKKMTVEKSKKMCADMLSLLSLLHTYGVHENISKNHIYVDGNVYKLSHFENFQLFKHFEPSGEDEDSVVVCRKRLETTIDIYALGVVLLESLTNSSIENDSNVLDAAIEDKLASLDESHKSMVSMMLNCKNHINEKNIPKYRFSAKSLLQHPWLSDKNFQSTKCVFLATYYSEPIEEMLFYRAKDAVKTVVDRLTSLYFDSKSRDYQMFFIHDLASGRHNINYIKDNELFVDVKEEYAGLRLVIVPILIANYTEPVQKAFTVVDFATEFGSVPIVIESAPMTEMDVCKTVIEQAFPVQDRGLPFVIVRVLPHEGRFNIDYKMCPKSLINERLKHTFPKTMDGDDYEIPADPPQYNIAIWEKLDLADYQPETATEVREYVTCEFSMKFDKMEEERRCRFAPFANQIEKINDTEKNEEDQQNNHSSLQQVNQ